MRTERETENSDSPEEAEQMSLAEDDKEEGEELNTNTEERSFPAPVKRAVRKPGLSDLGGDFGRTKGDDAETANRLPRRIFPPDPSSSSGRRHLKDMEREREKGCYDLTCECSYSGSSLHETKAGDI